MINLEGQVAIITGGSRGIGSATARLFARAGARVAVVYRDDIQAARKTLSGIRKSGGSGEIFRCRVENASDCRNLVKKVIKSFSGIDILVNCAGIWEYGEIDRMSPADWDRTININLTGTFNMVSSVVRKMKRQGYGRVINIASTAGQRGEPCHSHYAASKGGVISLTKSIATELIADGIWVNCVAPGWVLTDMVAPAMRNLKARRQILDSIPRKVIANPDEIAGPILFLASHLADNIVGEVLNVNGGSVLCG